MIGYHESTNRIERSTNNINDESLSKKYNVVSISNSIIGLSDA